MLDKDVDATISKIISGAQDLLKPYLYSFIDDEEGKCQMQIQLQKYLDDMVSKYPKECMDYLERRNIKGNDFKLTISVKSACDVPNHTITIISKIPCFAKEVANAYS